MHIQKKKNRRFLDITSLRNQQPYCHTESHHFVTRSHDCLKMQGFYSSVQQESVKKAWFQKGFRVQRWRLFLFRVSLFFTRFHASFLLIIAVISSKRPTNKKRYYWVLRAFWPSLNSFLCLKLVSNGQSIMVEEDLTCSIGNHSRLWWPRTATESSAHFFFIFFIISRLNVKQNENNI